MTHLDTHVVLWLYAGETERLSAIARERLEADELAISPIVQLELQYLRETERITADSALIIETLASSIGLAFCDLSFARVIIESIQQTWTRDPFDRIIVAQAVARKAPLISKDTTILRHYGNAIW